MNLITYWGYISIILFMAFIPGFAITTHFKKLSTVEQLATSFGFSFIVLALMLPFLAFKLDYQAQFIFISIIIVSVWYLIKSVPEFKLEVDAVFLISVLIFGLILKFFLQPLWEYPVMGGDWFAHTFSIPFSFEMGNWAPPRDRPPLFNLLIYSYHKLLGTSLYQYWISQIISVVINSVYLFPAYLIAKKAFGDRVAKVSVLFMLVTPFLIFNTLYTWPKNAAMYGILMMIYFLFFSEVDIKLRYPLAGFFAGLGFWFHNYAVFYIGIAVLMLIYKEKIHKKLLSKDFFNNAKKLSYFLLVLLVVLSPYFAWVYSYYGTVSTSKFIYYPFAVKGYDSALSGDKQELFNTFYSTPLKEIVLIRISNAIVTLTPVALPINPVAISFPTYNPIFYYSHDYPGALSTLMYLLVVVWFVRYLHGKTKTDKVIVSFLVFPLIINLVLYGWREWGLVNQILHPTVPLLIMLGINELNRVSERARTALLYLVFAGALLECSIYAVIIKKFYIVEGGINSVIEAGRAFIPNFEVTNFVSAHFLLSDSISFFENLGISIILSLGIVYLFRKTGQ